MSFTQVQGSGLELADVDKFASTCELWKRLDSHDRLGEFHVDFFWGKHGL